MKIKILGTRANIKLHDYEHELFTGILIDDLILIDIGEKLFLENNPKLILITHYHPDHAYFIKDHSILKLPCPIYGPEKNKFVPESKIIKEAFIWKNYRIIPIPTLHSFKVKSQGYIIENDDKRIFFSSDIAWIKKENLKTLGTLDLIITEASHLKKGGYIYHNKKNEIYGHMGIPDTIKIFRNHTNKVVFIHLGSWFLRDINSGIDKIKQLEDKNLKLEIATDGKEYFV